MKKLGISTGAVANWKNGVIPNGKTLQKIADYFDVKIDYLLSDAENNKQESSNEYNEIINYLDDLPIRERRRAKLFLIEYLEDNFPLKKKLSQKKVKIAMIKIFLFQ